MFTISVNDKQETRYRRRRGIVYYELALRNTQGVGKRVNVRNVNYVLRELTERSSRNVELENNCTIFFFYAYRID